MQVKVKNAFALDGELITAGTHTLPDSVAHHWYFKGLVKSGVITILSEPQPEAPAAPGLAEPEAEKAKEEPEAEKAKEEPEAEKAKEEPEAPVEPEAEKPKHDHHKGKHKGKH